MEPTRMIRAAALSFVVTLVLYPARAVGESETSFGDETLVFELDNGLQVVLQPDMSVAHVAVSVSYPAGERWQPRGYRGLAELTSRLMSNGSRNVEAGEYHRRLERAGAIGVGAWTTPDAVTFSQVVPPQHLATVLWLESDRMASMLASLDRRALRVARNGLIRDIHGAEARSAVTGLEEVIGEVIYPADHPYRRIGVAQEDIEAIRLRQVQWFFQQHYGPADARIALVGRFDVARARSLVEQYFSTIRSSHRARRAVTPAPLEPLEGRIRVVYGALTTARTLRMIWVTPGFLRDGDAELDIVAYVLAHGHRSRLHRRLVEEVGLSSSVYAWQTSRELGSTFRVYVQATPEGGFEEIVAGIEEEVQRLCEEPLEPAELERVVQLNRERELIDSQSLSERAQTLSRIRSPLAEDGVYRVEDNIARYDSVTPESVREAACRYLPVNGRLVVLVVPWDRASERGAIVTQEAGR